LRPRVRRVWPRPARCRDDASRRRRSGGEEQRENSRNGSA
jgi:hypothetical protein